MTELKTKHNPPDNVGRGISLFLPYEPAQDKTYNKPCATSEDPDQTAHPRSLIRDFADRMCRLQPSGYTKNGEREPLP